MFVVDVDTNILSLSKHFSQKYGICSSVSFHVLFPPFVDTTFVVIDKIKFIEKQIILHTFTFVVENRFDR